MAKSEKKNEKGKVKIEIETEGKNAEASIAENARQPGEEPEKAGENEKAQQEEKSELETALDSLAAEKDKYLRLAAEYDNFRKRTAKERDMTYSNAKTDVICRLLPVYDNLERAIKMECSDEAYYKGIEMTMTQLTDILKDLGVAPIPASGEPFDPNLHDAVMRVEDPELGEGIIKEECRKGFMIGDRIIRHSTVVVAN